jgi:hypothetical protein
MLVLRWTWYTKPLAAHPVRNWIKSYNEYGLPKLPHGSRIYASTPLGPWDLVVWELKFDGHAEFDAWHHEFWAAPRVREFLDAGMDFIERGGSGEFWSVEPFE